MFHQKAYLNLGRVTDVTIEDEYKNSKNNSAGEINFISYARKRDQKRDGYEKKYHRNNVQSEANVLNHSKIYQAWMTTHQKVQ